MQESRWKKNLIRDNEEATACSVTAEISGVIYMNMYIGRGEVFGCLFCFVLFRSKSRGCTMCPGRKEGGQNGRKEAENTFRIKIVCMPRPAKL